MIFINSIVQVNELGPDGWEGCIVQVTKSGKDFVEGYIKVPELGLRFIRLLEDQYEYIGSAKLTKK